MLLFQGNGKKAQGYRSGVQIAAAEPNRGRQVMGKRAKGRDRGRWAEGERLAVAVLGRAGREGERCKGKRREQLLWTKREWEWVVGD